MMTGQEMTHVVSNINNDLRSIIEVTVKHLAKGL